MDISIQQNKLVAKIKEYHLLFLDERQVYKRLKSLQSDLLRQTKHKLTSQHTRARAEREALTHPEYVDFIEKIAETNSSQIRHRIRYETHLMLFKARQSLRKHSRRL